MIVFQSRFGKEEWLKPYIEETLRTLPKNGVKKIDLVCPGFSADCVETLEEIALQDRDMFVASGGSEYNYIPALNDDSAHIDALSKILLERV
jgi:ferrochelatase